MDEDGAMRRFGPLLLILLAACAGAEPPVGAATVEVFAAPPAPSAGPAAATPAPGEATYTGMCDASAAVMIDDTHFVVADDESNVLRAYALGGGPPVATSADLSEAAGATPHEGGHRELDLEGAARVGDVVYWIGSHGNNKKGKPRPGRHRLLATKLALEGGVLRVDVLGVGRDMTKILAVSPELGELGIHAAEGIPPKAPGGTNIEGLAASPKGTLYLGFRNPVPDGRALIVEIGGLEKFVAGGGGPLLRSFKRVSLDGQGIRSLESRADDLIVLTGPVAGGGPHRVHFPPTQHHIELPDGFFGESLFITPTGLYALSDDGTVDVGGVPCKAAPPERRSFRGLDLSAR